MSFLTIIRLLYQQFVCLFGFLTSSSTTRLYRGRAPRQSVWQFYVLPHTRQSWETMTSVSASHIIPTPTQPVGSGRPQRESNPGPPHQESRALPTELPRPPIPTDNRPSQLFNTWRRESTQRVRGGGGGGGGGTEKSEKARKWLLPMIDLYRMLTWLNG